MPQPTKSFNDAQDRNLLGVPEDGQWCEVTLRNGNKEMKDGFAQYKAFGEDKGVFLDIRVEGITDSNVDAWRLWNWKPAVTDPDDAGSGSES